MAKTVECVIVMKYPFEEVKETEDYIGCFIEDVEEELLDGRLWDSVKVAIIDE